MPDRGVVGRLLVPAAAFEIAARDDVLFYNDPATSRAGVIHLDGSHIQIAKYDPQHPKKGLDQGSTKAKVKITIKPPVLRRLTTGPKGSGGNSTTDPGSHSGSGGSPGSSGQSGSSSGQSGSSSGQSGSSSGQSGSSSSSPPPPFKVTDVVLTPNPVVAGSPVRVDVAVSGAPRASCTWTVGSSGSLGCDTQYTPSTAGTFAVSVQAKSTNGDSATGSASLTVDPYVPPLPGEPTILIPNGCQAADMDLTIQADPGSGPIDAWHWTVSGVASTAAGNRVTFHPPSQGNYRVSVYTSNAAGNSPTDSATISVCDVTPPDLSIKRTGEDTSRATVLLSADDPQSSVASKSLTAVFTIFNECFGTMSTRTVSGTSSVSMPAGSCVDPETKRKLANSVSVKSCDASATNTAQPNPLTASKKCT
jgi:hypothetical protein